jgi:hypothetical protein
MCRNLFAFWPLLTMLPMAGADLPAHAATSCTAGLVNPTASAQLIESTPTSDFAAFGSANITITHNQTGLMWKRCAEGQAWDGSATCAGLATRMTWASALQAANTANAAAFAGYADWRLPNIKELESIVEFCGAFPAINQAAFPATPSLLFWSASTYMPDPSTASIVTFADGGTSPEFKTNIHYVRLVRGGLTGDPFDALNPTASRVTYAGNGNTGGSVPIDNNVYAAGATVTVLGNTGSLVKTGYAFANWNTAANGGATTYAPGATFIMGSGKVLLFAKWARPAIPILMLLLD